MSGMSAHMKTIRRNIPAQVIWFLAAAGITGDTVSPDISLSYKVTIQTLTGSKDVKKMANKSSKVHNMTIISCLYLHYGL